ncbi:MAG: hypothetical protein ABIQ02_12595 [Saprospiraceae bacterium]
MKTSLAILASLLFLINLKSQHKMDKTLEGDYYLHMHEMGSAVQFTKDGRFEYYFEVTLSPSLVNVSFKGIDFIIEGDVIGCLPNYFLPYDNIRYTKE